MEKMNSIWNWDLWHKYNTETIITKDKPDFIKKMNEKSKQSDKKSANKNNNSNEKA